MNRRWFGSVMLFWSLYPAFIFLNTSVSSGMTKRKSRQRVLLEDPSLDVSLSKISSNWCQYCQYVKSVQKRTFFVSEYRKIRTRKKICIWTLFTQSVYQLVMPLRINSMFLAVPPIFKHLKIHACGTISYAFLYSIHDIGITQSSVAILYTFKHQFNKMFWKWLAFCHSW